MREHPDPSRRKMIAAIALAGIAPLSLAQTVTGTRRLGILAIGSAAAERRNWAPMLAILAGLGFREGAGLVIEWRFAEDSAQRLPELARELAAARLDAAVTIGTLPTRALQRAASTLPIVTGGVADPILGGFAESLARPGGTVTGLSLGGTDIAQLQVGMLQAVMPKLARIVIVRGGDDGMDHEVEGPMVAAARQAGIAATPVVVKDTASLEAALRGLRASGGAAFIYNADNVTGAQLVEATLRHKVAAMFPERRSVSAGGLMSFNMYHEDRARRIAALLDKVLRGMKPADSPFELPGSSLFVLNRRSAGALGLAFPPELLARADEVID
jgi:putative ABC transport system substrate-binding protein